MSSINHKRKLQLFFPVRDYSECILPLNSFAQHKKAIRICFFQHITYLELSTTTVRLIVLYPYSVFLILLHLSTTKEKNQGNGMSPNDKRLARQGEPHHTWNRRRKRRLLYVLIFTIYTTGTTSSTTITRSQFISLLLRLDKSRRCECVSTITIITSNQPVLLLVVLQQQEHQYR